MPSPGKRSATIWRPPDASGLNFANIPDRTNITSLRGAPGSRKGRRGCTWSSRYGRASRRLASRGSSPAETNVSRRDTPCSGDFARRLAMRSLPPRTIAPAYVIRPWGRTLCAYLRILTKSYAAADLIPRCMVAPQGCPCLQLRPPLSGARGLGYSSLPNPWRS
jgi:hypothetical protein